MTKDEFRQAAAIGAMQSLLETKNCIIAEIEPALIAKISVRIADELTNEFYKTNESKNDNI